MKNWAQKLVVLCVLLFGITGTAQNRSDLQRDLMRVPGEVIVSVSGNMVSALQSPLERQRFFQAALSGLKLEEAKPFATDSSLFLLRLENKDQTSAAIRSLSGKRNVRYAEPNHVITLNALPDDPEFNKLWSLQNNGQNDDAGQKGISGADIAAASLWEQGHIGSREIKVAVIDTGIDYQHPDLAANILINEAESGENATNGIDDDGNGFIDDTYGWNFFDNSKDPIDDHSHGTHVAGTIGAVGNNGVGIVGVNWEVSMLAVKFLSKDGAGTTQGAVEAINYARMRGAHIMNNSWGGGGASQALEESVIAAKEAGILFVAAAGNSSQNTDDFPHYPSGIQQENVISVAATDNRDQLASFSNYGKKTVHVAAPGVKIYSTIKGGGYKAYSGTSMATPHVAGMAALLLAANPEWGIAELKERLIATSDPDRRLRSKVVSGGRVNLSNAYTGYVPPFSGPSEDAWVNQAYELESPHPYPKGFDESYVISHPGAKFVRVVFEKVDVESRYDSLTVGQADADGNMTIWEKIDGLHENYVSEYVEGDTLHLRLRADEIVHKWGFKVSHIQVILE